MDLIEDFINSRLFVVSFSVFDNVSICYLMLEMIMVLGNFVEFKNGDFVV